MRHFSSWLIPLCISNEILGIFRHLIENLKKKWITSIPTSSGLSSWEAENIGHLRHESLSQIFQSRDKARDVTLLKLPIKYRSLYPISSSLGQRNNKVNFKNRVGRLQKAPEKMYHSLEQHLGLSTIDCRDYTILCRMPTTVHGVDSQTPVASPPQHLVTQTYPHILSSVQRARKHPVKLFLIHSFKIRSLNTTDFLKTKVVFIYWQIIQMPWHNLAVVATKSLGPWKKL